MIKQRTLANLKQRKKPFESQFDSPSSQKNPRQPIFQELNKKINDTNNNSNNNMSSLLDMQQLQQDSFNANQVTFADINEWCNK